MAGVCSGDQTWRMAVNVIASDMTVSTRDDVQLTVRPVAAGDAQALVDFFRSVSADDRRFRFLSAQAHVGAS